MHPCLQLERQAETRKMLRKQTQKDNTSGEYRVEEKPTKLKSCVLPSLAIKSEIQCQKVTKEEEALVSGKKFAYNRKHFDNTKGPVKVHQQS